MAKVDRWHSNLPRPSKVETPIYYVIYDQWVNDKNFSGNWVIEEKQE